MSRTTWQTLIGCALALVLGAAAGGISSLRDRRPRATSASSKSTEPAELSAADGMPVARAMETPANDPLPAKLRAQQGAERWLTLLAELETAQAEDIPRLLRAVGADSAAVRMLGARWAELKPRHMFNYLYSDHLLPNDSPNALPLRGALDDVLIEEWVKSDVAAAAKALNDAPNFRGRDDLRMMFINQAMKEDVERGLVAMKDWSVRHYAPDMKKVGDWAARDPRHAAEVVSELGIGYAAQEALKFVGQAWGKSDPQSALNYAAGLNGQARSALASEVMGTWAERDLDGAIAFASAQDDPAFRGALGRGLLGAWAKRDPNAALDWSEQHLQGSARTEAVKELINVVAKSDLPSAAELVSGMQPGPAQNAATASIFATWFEKGKDQQDAAFAWLNGVTDPDARRAAMERIQWNWIWKQPDAAREFLAGPHAALATDSFVMQVARSQTAKNPAAAMKWTDSLAPEQAGTARSAVLSSWLQIRPEGAADYVRGLPPGSERESAIQTVSQTLLWQSPAQAGIWLRSL
ncbi:MAG: hypothetical protein ABI680_17610, partial [Chthoniobacteraceae bacterium]